MSPTTKPRLGWCVRTEIEEDAARHGDARRSPLIERQQAEALEETALIPSEPVTVVLSEKGWVRAAKGHDIDAAELSYRAGDGFKAAALGRSHQLAVFIDSTGRCYSLPAHTLPSARGLGEPLSGRLTPPDGASFQGLMLGQPEALFLLASDAGYGFVSRLEDLYAKNKAGKAVLSLPKGAGVLAPAPVGDLGSDRVAAATNTGRLLVFPVAELPQLLRGKGLKMIHVTAARVAAREEFVIAVTIVAPGVGLMIQAGQRQLSLKGADLERYLEERGRRGEKLPRGFRNVAAVQPLQERSR